LHGYLNDSEKGASSVLRDPQIGVVEDLARFYEQDKRRGFIKLPTGSGKTVIFVEIAEALNLPTLVVVPKIGIGDQTIDKFQKFAPDMKVSSQFGGAKDDSGSVVVTTYQYLAQAVQDGRIDLSRFQFVILDEAHKSLGPGMLDVLERIEESTRVLGFTATDAYNEEKNLENLLGECISDLPIASAVKLGMLTPISVIVAKTDIDISDVDIKANGEYDERQLEKRIIASGVNQACLDIYKQAFAEKSAIGFCASVAHAEEAARLFNEQGIPAAAVSGSLSRKEQARILDEYRAGSIKVLFNADLLIEGFDSERASVCFNLTPTSSLISAEQRAGRAFRLNPNDPNKVGYVVEFVLKDSRRQSPTILYSDIIGGVACPPPAQQASAIRKAVEETFERLESARIQGVSIHVDTESVLEISASLKPATANMLPPEEWVSVKDLAASLGSTRTTVMRTMSALSDEGELSISLESHCGTFRGSDTGRMGLYCSPTLAEAITGKHKALEAPAGWVTVSGVERELQVSQGRASKLMTEVAGSDPKMVSLYSIGRGGLRRFYSPECVAEARRMLSVNPETLPTFSIKNAIARHKVPEFVMHQWLDDLKTDGALCEVSRVSKTGKTLTTLHQSPVVEERLREKASLFHGRDLAAGGTIEQIARDMQVDEAQVQEAFQVRTRGAREVYTIGIDLELENLLKQTISASRSGPPAGWVTRAELMRVACSTVTESKRAELAERVEELREKFGDAEDTKIMAKAVTDRVTREIDLLEREVRHLFEKRTAALGSVLPPFHRLHFRSQNALGGATQEFYSPLFIEQFLAPEHWRDLSQPKID
jgi:superfamily II DNA or RNA helicase